MFHFLLNDIKVAHNGWLHEIESRSALNTKPAAA